MYFVRSSVILEMVSKKVFWGTRIYLDRWKNHSYILHIRMRIVVTYLSMVHNSGDTGTEKSPSCTLRGIEAATQAAIRHHQRHVAALIRD